VRRVLDNRARLNIEVAALVAITVAAILAMHVYIRRSFMGRYRMLSDEVGSQYEPGSTTVSHNIVTATYTNEYQLPDPGNALQSISYVYSNSVTDEDRLEQTP
jgi:hypothetical protein